MNTSQIRSSFRVTFVALAVTAVLATTMTAAEASHARQPVRVGESIGVIPTAVLAARTQLTVAATDLSARVDPAVAGNVTTGALASLSTRAARSVADLAYAVPYERDAPSREATGLTPLESDAVATARIFESAAAAIAMATEHTVAWEAELAAERERIRVAAEEAARKAAEIAAAAQAAARPHTSAAGAPRAIAAAPANESVEQRVARIAGSLPFVVQYQFGSCAISPIACYTVGSDHIIIGSGALAQKDCRVAYFIAHEYRHLLQQNEGLIQYDAVGAISNRDWLESDAMSFGYRYGCR